MAKQNDSRNGEVVVVWPGIQTLIEPVRELALELAAGDPLRIEVVDPETAIVLNHSIDLRSLEKRVRS